MIRLGFFLVCLASETLQFTPADPPNIHITKNISLGFIGDLALSTVESHSSRVMCVFDSWAIHREEEGKFGMEDINATLCTHLIIRSVEIQSKTDMSGKEKFRLVNGEILESESDEMYVKAVVLKEQNPKLKLILSVGGLNEGVRNFQHLSYNPETLSNFTKDVVEFLKGKELDGLVVEWMWPGNDTDKKAVTDLIGSLSKAFNSQNLELGLTLPADTDIIAKGYDIPALEGNVDYFIIIIIMGQDLAGNWGKVAGHHSPLLPLSEKTVGKTVKFVLDKKISPLKVILGIPFVGRTFKLENSQVDISSLGAPILTGNGIQGTFNQDGKVLNYNEICHKLTNPGNQWKVYEDAKAKVPFMKDANKNWVSFDDTKSVQAKVEFGQKHGLGGYAAWSITNDDFKGNLCGGGINYPLLRTINYVLSILRRDNLDVTTARDNLDVTTARDNLDVTTARDNLDVTTARDILDNTTRESILSKVDAGSAITTGTETDTDSFSSVVVVLYVIVALLGMILLLVALMLLAMWKRRENDKKGKLSRSEISRFKQGYANGAPKDRRNAQTIMLLESRREDDFNCNPYDICLEIPHTEYEICADEILGSGAYGFVVKGKVRNEVVAVKTVKPSSNKDYVLSLLEEIKVMTYLGKHEHILGLIGANTALLHRGIVYIFVELCPLGSLEKYLKDNKSKFEDLIKNDEFTREVSPPKENTEGISSATLLIWAHQISNAMLFLASKNVIHGDLATRNVLLRDKHLVKISDFGLSRKMYAYCNYIKQKQEPLPWRYMSLEALKNMEFSTKSDVWAFGVTLWEIFTLGDVPYPGMSYTLGFIDDLLGGLRMAKPRYATTELYAKTMLQTWNENSKDRPSFEELSVFLGDAVERITFQQEYMNVNNYTN